MYRLTFVPTAAVSHFKLCSCLCSFFFFFLPLPSNMNCRPSELLTTAFTTCFTAKCITCIPSAPSRKLINNHISPAWSVTIRSDVVRCDLINRENQEIKIIILIGTNTLNRAGILISWPHTVHPRRPHHEHGVWLTEAESPFNSHAHRRLDHRMLEWTRRFPHTYLSVSVPRREKNRCFKSLPSLRAAAAGPAAAAGVCVCTYTAAHAPHETLLTSRHGAARIPFKRSSGGNTV